MKLPNAPLLEVIFDMHWDVVKTAQAGALVSFGYDPGFRALEDRFDTAMDAAGYTAREVVGQPGPPLANRIVKRYRKGDGQPYPLFQIGHGIFACNVSTDYEWSDFEALCLEGLKYLLECYPKSPISPFRPSRAELRYVDVFNKELLGHESLSDFLKVDTKLDHGGLAFMASDMFTGTDHGRLSLQRSIAKTGIGWFRFDVGNATTNNEGNLVLSSHVVKDAEFSEEEWTVNTGAAVRNWLREAHEITSEFFGSFVSEDLMEKFKKTS